jgi:hypothetical protein
MTGASPPTRWALVVHDDSQRARAIEWCRRARPGFTIEVREPTRTHLQNARMWAMLTDVAEQLVWHGQTYIAEDWKDFFMHALRRAKWMPAEEGGMVPIGMQTSRLTVKEHGELMEVIAEFGARNGVVFKDPEEGKT